jgi:hypothetical protein
MSESVLMAFYPNLTVLLVGEVAIVTKGCVCQCRGLLGYSPFRRALSMPGRLKRVISPSIPGEMTDRKSIEEEPHYVLHRAVQILVPSTAMG